MPDLSPAELVDKSIAPIKRSHWRPAEADKPDSQLPTEPSKAAAKSKKQQKRDRKEQQKKAGVCTSFLQGNCVHGDTCRSALCAQSPAHKA